MKADIYNLKNEVVGSVDLPESVFGAPARKSLVKQILLAQLANARRPWAHTKDRSDVRGGGKKPYRQKGTGQARHGSRRSPIWKGGGVTHGPRNDRDYSQKVNKKMKQAAIASVFSGKAKENEIKFIESLIIPTHKTKDLVLIAKPLAGVSTKAKKLDTLFITESGNTNVTRATRNIPKTKALTVESLNIYDLLNYKHILLDVRVLPILAKKMTITK